MAIYSVNVLIVQLLSLRIWVKYMHNNFINYFHIGLKMVCLRAWEDGSMGNKLAMQIGVHGFRSPTLSYKAGFGSIHPYISTRKWRQDNPKGCWPVGVFWVPQEALS